MEKLGFKIGTTKKLLMAIQELKEVYTMYTNDQNCAQNGQKIVYSIPEIEATNGSYFALDGDASSVNETY